MLLSIISSLLLTLGSFLAVSALPVVAHSYTTNCTQSQNQLSTHELISLIIQDIAKLYLNDNITITLPTYQSPILAARQNQEGSQPQPQDPSEVPWQRVASPNGPSSGTIQPAPPAEAEAAESSETPSPTQTADQQATEAPRGEISKGELAAVMILSVFSIIGFVFVVRFILTTVFCLVEWCAERNKKNERRKMLREGKLAGQAQQPRPKPLEVMTDAHVRDGGQASLERRGGEADRASWAKAF